MSRSAISVFVFGVYLVFLGLGFLIIPNTLLGLFGAPPSSEVWIRLVGMLLLGLAYYYMGAARMGLTPFFRLSVHGRALVILFLIAFAYLKLVVPRIIFLGVIDLLAAIWTALALRSESQPVFKIF
jgi:hypothetical protein